MRGEKSEARERRQYRRTVEKQHEINTGPLHKEPLAEGSTWFLQPMPSLAPSIEVPCCRFVVQRSHASGLGTAYETFFLPFPATLLAPLPSWKWAVAHLHEVHMLLFCVIKEKIGQVPRNRDRRRASVARCVGGRVMRKVRRWGDAESCLVSVSVWCGVVGWCTSGDRWDRAKVRWCAAVQWPCGVPCRRFCMRVPCY